MICCTVCKNNGYCPLWKSEKVTARGNWGAGYRLKLGVITHKGMDLAMNCKKFQKMI